MATNKKCRTKERVELTEPKHQFNHSTIATNATKNSNRNIDNPYPQQRNNSLPIPYA